MSTISFLSRRAKHGATPSDADHGASAGQLALEDVEAMWKRILHVEDVSPGDNLFEVGGTSLHAMLLASTIERMSGSLDLVRFLENPTFDGLCANITISS